MIWIKYIVASIVAIKIFVELNKKWLFGLFKILIDSMSLNFIDSSINQIRENIESYIILLATNKSFIGHDNNEVYLNFKFIYKNKIAEYAWRQIPKSWKEIKETFMKI